MKFAEKVARQKGLAQSRSGSVQPSPATLVRVAFYRSSPSDLLEKMARQKGLEPLTYCLEGSCSIQLSYWRISYGAGDGNRTRVSSLEGWCSTIELHPQIPNYHDSAREFYHRIRPLSRADS